MWWEPKRQRDLFFIFFILNKLLLQASSASSPLYWYSIANPTSASAGAATATCLTCDIIYDRSAMNNYIRAVRELACEILDLMAEGLWVRDPSYFSKMIRDVENDSFFRINHYPSCCNNNTTRVGFGEHSDPQILTILRSNDVGGLQISPDHGVWIPVAPDSAAFCVNVGDVLQVKSRFCILW